jgi:NAD(P)H-nitrite reductase large subunit
MKHVVIIGNGISGITAARHIRKRSDFRITVISSESEYFFSRTALMYIYMGQLKFEHTKPYVDSFWRKNKIELFKDHVLKVNANSKSVLLKSGNALGYDELIIATGSKPLMYDWPGQNLEGVQGLYSLQNLERLEVLTKNIKKAVIVGGGLVGVEMAEMLRSRGIDVTFVVREKEFWNNVLPLQEASLISRHIRSHNIDLKLDTELKEILPDENGRVKVVVTNHDEIIPCEFVGITTGVTPNIDFLKDSGIELNRGVLVNEFLQTSNQNIYAVGDCVERRNDLSGRKKIEQVWYTGRMMGEVVAQTICGDKTKYAPGPWFNSAKFFDIEYQTYGNVGNQLNENEEEFYWEHKDGLKCMHFVWDKSSNEFIGINSFGIRLRHNCFDQWLREKKSIHYVVQNLGEANFDPEFFTRYEDEIISSFTEQFPLMKIKQTIQ